MFAHGRHIRMVCGALLVILLMGVLAACGGAAEPAPAEPAAEEAVPAAEEAAEPAAEEEVVEEEAAAGDDLLAQVMERGTLRISTDANYAPQSFRTADGAWEGFDIDVGREVAERLGVEPEFMNISWDVITAGNWNNRWDINIGSMTVTPDRKEVILFTDPYYYTPAAFVVHADSEATSIDDLNGMKIGVGTATTYQEYLEGTLDLEGEEILVPPPAGEVVAYETDQLALQDLALGAGTRLDAVLTALPTAQDAIESGQPFKILGDPVYYEDLAVALDKNSPVDPAALHTEINRIIQEMHGDGTLTELSMKHYGVDLTKKVE